MNTTPPSILPLLAIAIAVAAIIFGGLYPQAQYWCVAFAGGAALVAILLCIRVVIRRQWALLTQLEVVHVHATMSIAAELHAMHVVLQRFPECTMPTSGWSMRFTNLHAIVELLDNRRPLTIVEFGSGISTLCVAAWLRNRGCGHLFSFDHSETWADVTMSHLTKHGLDNYVTLTTAPLAPTPSHGTSVLWYQIADHLKTLPKIDFVIIDGPPAGKSDIQLSRLPALNALSHQLSPSATIVLDDANRPGERQVVSIWSEDLPAFNFRHIDTTSGLAILERHSSETTSTPPVQSNFE